MVDGTQANAVTGSDTTQVVRIPESEKKLAMIVYILQAVSVIFGVTSIIGVIINYVKRSEISDPVIKSHFTWQIKTFWWAFGLFFLSMVLMAVVIGWFLMIGVMVWYIYRVVKGIIRLNDGKSI